MNYPRTDAEKVAFARKAMRRRRRDVNRSLAFYETFDADGRQIDCHQADSFLLFIEQMLYPVTSK